jgi:hypothetical protein
MLFWRGKGNSRAHRLSVKVGPGQQPQPEAGNGAKPRAPEPVPPPRQRAEEFNSWLQGPYEAAKFHLPLFLNPPRIPGLPSLLRGPVFALRASTGEEFGRSGKVPSRAGFTSCQVPMPISSSKGL